MSFHWYTLKTKLMKSHLLSLLELDTRMNHPIWSLVRFSFLNIGSDRLWNVRLCWFVYCKINRQEYITESTGRIVVRGPNEHISATHNQKFNWSRGSYALQEFPSKWIMFLLLFIRIWILLTLSSNLKDGCMIRFVVSAQRLIASPRIGLVKLRERFALSDNSYSLLLQSSKVANFPPSYAVCGFRDAMITLWYVISLLHWLT